MATIAPFGRPFSMMAKPISACCNLSCAYCYYKGTRDEHNSVSSEFFHHSTSLVEMKDSLLEEFIRQYIEAQTVPEVMFTWHGGEPLMLSISFFQKVLKWQQYYAQGRRISNCLQTNGTLLTDEWCRFFADNHFLIGISIDGPKDQHDVYRRNYADAPSFDRVMHGLELLNRYGVEWNALATVNAANVLEPRRFYEFFRSIDCRFLQFTPVVERVPLHANESSHSFLPGTTEGGEVLPFSVTPEAWGNFLCEVFDLWVRRDVGSVFVQLFDATLANWVSVQPGVCSMGKDCGNASVIEADGTVYVCDHFAFPDFRLGNIRHQTITSMIYGERLRHFARQKTDALTPQCKKCRFLFACHGECPRNRFVRDENGHFGHNYLCAGYYRFFTHVSLAMNFMARELREGRPPANIMQHLPSLL